MNEYNGIDVAKFIPILQYHLTYLPHYR